MLQYSKEDIIAWTKAVTKGMNKCEFHEYLGEKTWNNLIYLGEEEEGVSKKRRSRACKTG